MHPRMVDLIHFDKAVPGRPEGQPLLTGEGEVCLRVAKGNRARFLGASRRRSRVAD